MPVIKTKCVYGVPNEDDGFRVLVTRYWPRGVKKEKQDVWFRELGPEASLIKLWKSGKISWDEFKRRYLLEHKGEPKKRALGELKAAIKSSGAKMVTLLCACREEDVCHRGILKDMLGGK